MRTALASVHPLSVRLDVKLLKRTEQYAKKHKVGVTTALRMIVAEHFDFLDNLEQSEEARLWQAAQADAAYREWKAGKIEREYTLEEVLAAADATIEKRRKRR